MNWDFSGAMESIINLIQTHMSDVLSLTSLPYIIFLSVAVLIYYLLPHVTRNFFLLLCSCFFYLQTGLSSLIYIGTATGLAYLYGLVAPKLAAGKLIRKKLVGYRTVAYDVETTHPQETRVTQKGDILNSPDEDKNLGTHPEAGNSFNPFAGYTEDLKASPQYSASAVATRKLSEDISIDDDFLPERRKPLLFSLNEGGKKIFSASAGNYVRTVAVREWDDIDDLDDMDELADDAYALQAEPVLDPEYFEDEYLDLPLHAYSDSLQPAAPAQTKEDIVVIQQYRDEPIYENVYRRSALAGFVFFIALLSVLSLLIVFRYADFLLQASTPLLLRMGINPRPLNLLAPLGISFFTLQSLGYIIDVYKGQVKAERNPIDFALFVSFFPQLLCGPIGRSSQLMPQIKSRRRIKYSNLVSGLQRFIWGLFKKVVISNWFFLLSDSLYNDMTRQSGLAVMLAALLYGFYIYLDFSAYTDMALGAAKLFGFTLIENFGAPLFATSFSCFWKRWHISLTTWLNDYIYNPLVNSRWCNRLFNPKKWRDSEPHLALNILVLFLLYSIWHGAALCFLVWGTLHCLFRLTEEMFNKIKEPAKKKRWLQIVSNLFKRILLLLGTTLAGVFFRFGIEQKSLSNALQALSLMLEPSDPKVLWQLVLAFFSTHADSAILTAPIHIYLIAFCFLLVFLLDYLVIYRATKKRVNPGNVLGHIPLPVRLPLYLLIFLCIYAAGYFGISEFIYFGF